MTALLSRTLLCLCVFAFGAFAALKPAFSGAAAGVHGAFVISPDDDIFWQDLGGGGGVQADVFFTLGGSFKGKFAWTPSLSFWGKSAHNNHYAYGYYYAGATYRRFEIDLGDFKYTPPVPFMIKPYIGIGGPGIVIHHFEADHPADWNYAWDGYRWEHTDADAAFNCFVGIDIAAFKNAYPFIEMHAKATSDQTFRIKGGLNIVLK